MPTNRYRAAAAGWLITALAPAAGAQLGVQLRRDVPTAYAITGARIVPVSGPALDRGTIIVRNGLIAAVGANVPVPADVRLVDGTGLTVYPGFIAAFSNLGYESANRGGSAASEPAARIDPAPNSRKRAGLQPEVLATTLLVDNADYAAAHAAGFTTALTVPSGGNFIGQSAVINLRPGDVQEVLVRSPVALHVGFATGGRGATAYPASLMGVFAALRQMLLDAQHYGAVQAAYAANPRGMPRPDNDPSLAALQPALKGQMPVYFSVATEREIERALDLAAEFTLKPVLVGAQEANLLFDRITSERVPVVLSVGAVSGGGGRGGAGETVRALRQRVESPKVPAAMQQGGVPYVLQPGNAYAQFATNLARVVTVGLSRDDALRAITIGPATMFGVADRLGSIEVGKIANLTLTRGDLFDAATRVVQLFVDGRQIELEPTTAPTGRGGR
jgi:imidazolonepropionase-like amidohydrolase